MRRAGVASRSESRCFQTAQGHDRSSEGSIPSAFSLYVHENVIWNETLASTAGNNPGVLQSHSCEWPLRSCSSAPEVGAELSGIPRVTTSRNSSAGRYEMFSKTKIALSAAIVLSTTFSASAATKPRLLYNVVPDLSAPSGSPVRDYITDPIMGPEPAQRRAPGRTGPGMSEIISGRNS